MQSYKGSFLTQEELVNAVSNFWYTQKSLTVQGMKDEFNLEIQRFQDPWHAIISKDKFIEMEKLRLLRLTSHDYYRTFRLNDFIVKIIFLMSHIISQTVLDIQIKEYKVCEKIEGLLDKNIIQEIKSSLLKKFLLSIYEDPKFQDSINKAADIEYLEFLNSFKQVKTKQRFNSWNDIFRNPKKAKLIGNIIKIDQHFENNSRLGPVFSAVFMALRKDNLNLIYDISQKEFSSIVNKEFGIKIKQDGISKGIKSPNHKNLSKHFIELFCRISA